MLAEADLAGGDVDAQGAELPRRRLVAGRVGAGRFGAGAALQMPPLAGREGFERPSVQIDRLDVLVQEPAAPAGNRGGAAGRARSIRARYLRRL